MTSTWGGSSSVPDPACRLEPVDAGHLDVHQHQVGLEAGRQFDGLLAVLGLADHLEAVGHLHDHPGRLAKRNLVVDDQHTDICHHTIISHVG